VFCLLNLASLLSNSDFLCSLPDVYKCFARNSSQILRSFRRLEVDSACSPRSKRVQLLHNVPAFRPFILQKYTLQSIYRSVTPPLFSFNFSSMFPIPQYASFNILDFSSTGRGKRKDISIPIAEVRARFAEFAASLIDGGISLYTNGSRRVVGDEDSSVGAAVYS